MQMKMKKLFISLSLIIVIIILIFFANQKIQTTMPIAEKQIKERQKNILEKMNEEYYEKQEQDKSEITKPMGAIILTTSKIQLADLELTEAEYAIKKTQLIQDFNLKELKIDDKERFVAMLNYEIQKWKTVNKRPFILNDITDKNLITKILNKTQ